MGLRNKSQPANAWGWLAAICLSCIIHVAIVAAFSIMTRPHSGSGEPDTFQHHSRSHLWIIHDTLRVSNDVQPLTRRPVAQPVLAAPQPRQHRAEIVPSGAKNIPEADSDLEMRLDEKPAVEPAEAPLERSLDQPEKLPLGYLHANSYKPQQASATLSWDFQRNEKSADERPSDEGSAAERHPGERHVADPMDFVFPRVVPTDWLPDVPVATGKADRGVAEQEVSMTTIDDEQPASHGLEQTEVKNEAVTAGSEAPGPVEYVPPGVIEKVPPTYPRRARRLSVEGRVTLELDIDELGNPVAVRLVASSGRLDLDAAAEEAVGKWRFSPATLSGEPISSTVEVNVVFRLD